MNKQKIIFILAVTILPLFISAGWYSLFRYQRILQNNLCGRTGAPCVYKMVPPSLLELITNKSSTEMRPPCDLTATTTDCTMPPSPLSDSPTPLPMQSGKIDEHLFIDLALRDVNFCGKTYKVKQVIIDGVDVVQRIAELATNRQIINDSKHEMADGICFNMQNNEINNISHVLDIPEVKNYISQLEQKIYIINTIGAFTVNSAKEEIYSIGAFDGTPTLIGNLK